MKQAKTLWARQPQSVSSCSLENPRLPAPPCYSHHVYNKLPNEQVDISWDGLESQCCRSSLLDWRQRLSVRNVCLPVLPHPLHNVPYGFAIRKRFQRLQAVAVRTTYGNWIHVATKPRLKSSHIRTTQIGEGRFSVCYMAQPNGEAAVVRSRSIRKGGPIRWKRRKATSTCGFHNCFKRRNSPIKGVQHELLAR
ncbi:unnamed protein product, partial [Nesidiocoris tenuis]